MFERKWYQNEERDQLGVNSLPFMYVFNIIDNVYERISIENDLYEQNKLIIFI